MTVWLHKCINGQWQPRVEIKDYSTIVDQRIESNIAPIDCHCGHSHYDHIGWRQSGTISNCRIVRCECSDYHTNWCGFNHHPEEA